MNKRSGAEERGSAERVQGATSEDGFVVRRIAGSATVKTYRCPGCDHEIRPGTPHVVAWPEWDVDDRRHWHTPCWRSRSRRGPTVQRSSRAPRY